MTGSDPKPLSVAIVALPDAVISTLAGIYDVLNGALMMGLVDRERPPFHVQIVGERSGPLKLASGVPVDVQAEIDDIEECDIVIVPSVLLSAVGWEKDRYPKLAEWVMGAWGSARNVPGPFRSKVIPPVEDHPTPGGIAPAA
jgi:transcriptional regulator GlxA family with amidase domain